MTMTRSFRFRQLGLLAIVCWLTLACETKPKPAPVQKTVVKPKETKPAPTSAPVAPVVSADAQALKEGLALYNDGQYDAAIKKLNTSSAIWTGQNKAIQLSAAKYMAFSYCVSGRQALCKQQFERALKIDPGFDLMPSEIGHPLWGPVFLQAKKAK